MAETAKRRSLPSEPAVPADSRVYAVGDVHGRCDLLGALHGLIRADAAVHPAVTRRVIVYLGDYIDRGPESRAVIDLLLDEPLADFEAVYLLGNHEDFLLRFLDDASVGPAWLFNGGEATVESYGIDAIGGAPRRREPMLWLQEELRRALPPRHLAFLRGLALRHVEGDYLFVHAGIRPGLPLEHQSEGDLLWIRREFLASEADHGRVVVHGHSIVRTPEVRRNRISIDTGAFASGRLTCLVLEGRTRIFLQT